MSNAPLTERFQLDIDLLRMERQRAENDAALRQAKHDLREAKIAEAEYGGSFRAFRDRLTGKKEAAETALRHAVQKAEADLAAAQQNLDAADGRIRELEDSLSRLPAWESLKSEETRELWHRLEVRYCAEWLIPHLEITLELLMARRAQFNGANAGQIKSLSELADIYSAPEAAAESCVPFIRRLRTAATALGMEFPEPAFFHDPTAFLSSATQYTRMDRINTAIGHTEKLRRLLPELQKQTEV